MSETRHIAGNEVVLPGVATSSNPNPFGVSEQAMGQLLRGEESPWDLLADRRVDGLAVRLHTLGSEILKNTPSVVEVFHDSGIFLRHEGPLEEVAPIFAHPMLHVSREEARRAYPSPQEQTRSAA